MNIAAWSNNKQTFWSLYSWDLITIWIYCVVSSFISLPKSLVDISQNWAQKCFCFQENQSKISKNPFALEKSHTICRIREMPVMKCPSSLRRRNPISFPEESLLTTMQLFAGGIFLLVEIRLRRTEISATCTLGHAAEVNCTEKV